MVQGFRSFIRSVHPRVQVLVGNLDVLNLLGGEAVVHVLAHLGFVVVIEHQGLEGLAVHLLQSVQVFTVDGTEHVGHADAVGTVVVRHEGHLGKGFLAQHLVEVAQLVGHEQDAALVVGLVAEHGVKQHGTGGGETHLAVARLAGPVAVWMTTGTCHQSRALAARKACRLYAAMIVSFICFFYQFFQSAFFHFYSILFNSSFLKDFPHFVKATIHIFKIAIGKSY